jgi:hypothetical protein
VGLSNDPPPPVTNDVLGGDVGFSVRRRRNFFWLV